MLNLVLFQYQMSDNATKFAKILQLNIREAMIKIGDWFPFIFDFTKCAHNFPAYMCHSYHTCGVQQPLFLTHSASHCIHCHYLPNNFSSQNQLYLHLQLYWLYSSAIYVDMDLNPHTSMCALLLLLLSYSVVVSTLDRQSGDLGLIPSSCNSALQWW